MPTGYLSSLASVGTTIAAILARRDHGIRTGVIIHAQPTNTDAVYLRLDGQATALYLMPGETYTEQQSSPYPMAQNEMAASAASGTQYLRVTEIVYSP